MTSFKPKKQIEKQSLENYLSLQYPVTVYPDTDGGYVAEIKDLPGCFTQGETLEETMTNINEARELWLGTVYENGDKYLYLVRMIITVVNYFYGCQKLYIVI